MTEYDYIVVGGGHGGLRAGGPAQRRTRPRGCCCSRPGSAERTRAMTRAGRVAGANLGSAADWGQRHRRTRPQAGPAAYPRGRALGGSGAINAMAHVRGHRAVYDGWAAGGAAGWGFADLLPYFQRSERAAGPRPALRGTDGPVRVARPSAEPASGRARVRRGAGRGRLPGHRRPQRRASRRAWPGSTWPSPTGERVSAADAYLRPVLARPNLTVHADCLAPVSLQVSNGRCTGLRYLRDGAAPPPLAQASAEVIVCAGAIGSPQLLIRSGIGPADQVRALGLDVVADIAQVGENLQDHPVILVSSTRACAAAPPASTTTGRPARRCAASWREPAQTCICSRSCCRSPRSDSEPPPSGFALVSSVVAPDSRGIGAGWPARRPMRCR